MPAITRTLIYPETDTVMLEKTAKQIKNGLPQVLALRVTDPLHFHVNRPVKAGTYWLELIICTVYHNSGKS